MLYRHNFVVLQLVNGSQVVLDWTYVVCSQDEWGKIAYLRAQINSRWLPSIDLLYTLLWDLINTLALWFTQSESLLYHRPTDIPQAYLSCTIIKELLSEPYDACVLHRIMLGKWKELQSCVLPAGSPLNENANSDKSDWHNCTIFLLKVHLFKLKRLILYTSLDLEYLYLSQKYPSLNKLCLYLMYMPSNHWSKLSSLRWTAQVANLKTNQKLISCVMSLWLSQKALRYQISWSTWCNTHSYWRDQTEQPLLLANVLKLTHRMRTSLLSDAWTSNGK